MKKENLEKDYIKEEKIIDGDDPVYISGDDRVLPVEFDRDITNCDIIFRIKDEDGVIIYSNEKEEGTHISDKSTSFEVSREDTKKIKSGEYKRSVTVYDNDTDKRVSTKPECFYIE